MKKIIATVMATIAITASSFGWEYSPDPKLEMAFQKGKAAVYRTAVSADTRILIGFNSTFMRTLSTLVEKGLITSNNSEVIYWLESFIIPTSRNMFDAWVASYDAEKKATFKASNTLIAPEDDVSIEEINKMLDESAAHTVKQLMMAN